MEVGSGWGFGRTGKDEGVTMVTPGTPDSRWHRPSLLGQSRCCRQTAASSCRPGCSPDSGWRCTETGTSPAKPNTHTVAEWGSQSVREGGSHETSVTDILHSNKPQLLHRHKA